MSTVKRLPLDELHWWRVDELRRVKAGAPVYLDEVLYVLTHHLSGMTGPARSMPYPQARSLVNRKVEAGWIALDRVWIGRGKDRKKRTVLRWPAVKRMALPDVSRAAGS